MTYLVPAYQPRSYWKQSSAEVWTDMLPIGSVFLLLLLMMLLLLLLLLSFDLLSFFPAVTCGDRESF
jgi:hypothetical protein